MKESIRVGMLLALTAGFIDSYTFAFHDARFASFQSGNMLQFGVNFARGDWSHALTFFWPVLFYLFGSALNQIIKRVRYINDLQWEELSVLVEASGIFFVAILEIFKVPSELPLSILAIFMAMQADTFTKLRGAAYVSTMNTGNLKTLGAMLTSFALTKQHEELMRARNTAAIIASFIFGAIIAYYIGHTIQGWAMFFPVGFLMIIWRTIVRDREIA
ncbi:DUF1275 domain-containing protein [Weissella diestrammenae]|uniref:DUF1275 domain-containing protein n=1 Tax=Weissella diestrammenae TaxID=1162633 RepID=A0A7G9T708_9LACO|nr:YoaK family protein [Weissella diestrammenae]MCM0582520.1 DUF1275 domain-containing protein [Weissella diestrammenae]QNN75883.1 DUF1275 domain-containing protein [Weissella diestrammenae]